MYSEKGPGWEAATPSPLLNVPNVTAHPSTTSVPITVLRYDGPLLCGFNVAIKGLVCVVFFYIAVSKFVYIFSSPLRGTVFGLWSLFVIVFINRKV